MINQPNETELNFLFHTLIKSEKNHFICQNNKEIQLSCLPNPILDNTATTMMLFIHSNTKANLFLYSLDNVTSRQKKDLLDIINQADQIITVISNQDFLCSNVPWKISLRPGSGQFLGHTLFELVAQWPYCNPKERYDFFTQWFLLLSDWLATYISADDKSLQTIEKAFHYIEQKAHDSHLSLKDTAAHCNLSSRMLQKKFQSFGFSFSRYVNELRLSNAAIQLFKSNDSITQIAFQCGFSSSAYFTKRFKERFEITPKDYRQKMKNTLIIDQRQHNDCPLVCSDCQLATF